MSTEKGISIVEIIFSIGVIVLVVSGTVSLVVRSTSLKTSSLQRKNASEMAEMVIEKLVSQKSNDEVGFWKLESVDGETLPQFNGYTYDVTFNRVETGDCSIVGIPATCVNAIVKIDWGDNQTLKVKRFFSR